MAFISVLLLDIVLINALKHFIGQTFAFNWNNLLFQISDEMMNEN